jgi:hypothetical protein
MADTHAAGQQLAFVRWGTQRLDKAVELVIERREQLGAEQMARLREVIADPAQDGDDAR